MRSPAPFGVYRTLDGGWLRCRPSGGEIVVERLLAGGRWSSASVTFLLDALKLADDPELMPGEGDAFARARPLARR